MIKALSNVRHETREAWLRAAADHIFSDLFARNGIPTPAQYRVSCGWATKAKAIGQCFPTTMSKDRTCEIFVSPAIDDDVRALDILVHEMVHAADDCKSGHRGQFRKWALAVGLEGKMTATVAGADLQAYLQDLIANKIGDYPHASLNRGGIKKQTTRMLKIDCAGCGFTARTSSKWIEQASWPAACPCCGEHALAPEGQHENTRAAA